MLKEPGYGGKINRRDKTLVAGKSFGLGGTQIKRTDIQAVVLCFVGNQRQGGTFKGQQTNNLNVGIAIRCFRKFSDQRLGGAAGGPNKNPLARFNQLDGFLYAAPFSI